MRQIEGNADELERLSHQFDSYAKSVIDYCAKDEIGRVAKRTQREKLLKQKLILELNEPVSEDLIRLLEMEKFTIEGNTVLIYNDALAESLRRIQNRKREVLLLSLCGYSLEEISDIVGILYETAKSTKSKAIREIRKKLNGESLF